MSWIAHVWPHDETRMFVASLSKTCTSRNGPRRMRRRSNGTPTLIATLRLRSFFVSVFLRSI